MNTHRFVSLVSPAGAGLRAHGPGTRRLALACVPRLAPQTGRPKSKTGTKKNRLRLLTKIGSSKSLLPAAVNITIEPTL
jgi:hypothetical protein